MTLHAFEDDPDYPGQPDKSQCSIYPHCICGQYEL